MKKAAVLGARQAGLIEAANPQPFDNWVVVKVHAAPMCTEYKRFLSGEPSEFLGHEAAGEVVAIAQPGRVQKVMQVIQKSPVIDKLISHTLPMSQIQEAFECSTSHASAKIILNPWG